MVSSTHDSFHMPRAGLVCSCSVPCLPVLHHCTSDLEASDLAFHMIGADMATVDHVSVVIDLPNVLIRTAYS